MGKKHKHEEHANHERWVISYADMVTLLFALFVVLYALGEVKLRKLKDLKQSLAFAFAFEGEGKTQDDGMFERGETGGDLIEGLPMLNAQDGEMREYLYETLPDQFKEQTGSSIEVKFTEDTVQFIAPISAFYPRLGSPNAMRLKPSVYSWMSDLLTPIAKIASQIRVSFEVPEVVGGLGSALGGGLVLPEDVCRERFKFLDRALRLIPQVTRTMILTEVQSVDRRGAYWEDVGTITIAFSNR